LGVQVIRQLSPGEVAALLALADWERSEGQTAAVRNVQERAHALFGATYSLEYLGECLASLRDRRPSLAAQGEGYRSWRLRAAGRRQALQTLGRAEFRSESDRAKLEQYLEEVTR